MREGEGEIESMLGISFKFPMKSDLHECQCVCQVLGQILPEKWSERGREGERGRTGHLRTQGFSVSVARA